MVSLGNGENRAYIYDRTGTDRLLELVHTKVEWPRELCDVSKATVQVAASRCAADHSRIATWAHSLVIYRDGVRAWEGPIRKVVHGPKGLDLTASDVLGWTQRRPLRTARTISGSPVVSELQWAIAHAFGTDNPNVLAFLQTLNPSNLGPAVELDLAVGASYVSEVLSSLVGNGGRYTALGRSILLWADSTVIGRTRTLVPERHLLTDVNVIQDGDGLATQVMARDDDGNTFTADNGPGTAVDPFYGYVGLLVSSGKVGPSQVAASVFQQSYPEPLSIDVPGGAALSCDAPFPMDQLVPGALVPVETTTATGKTVSATLVLDSLKVSQTAGQDETVGITLAPLTTAVS